MEPIYIIPSDSDEDDCGPGKTKKFKRKDPKSGQGGLQPIQVDFSTSALFCPEQLSNSVNEIDDEPADETEIKIEIINDDTTANDPLQVNEIPYNSVIPDKNDHHSLQPFFPRSQHIVVQKSAIPLTIKTLVNPPQELLKEIKQQEVKTFYDLSKFKPILPAVKQKNTARSAAVESNDQQNTSRIAVAVEEKSQENIAGNLCVVKECTGNVRHYFKVPDDVRFKIWHHCLSYQELKVDDLICDQHFIQEDVLSRPEDSHIGILKEHAVPSTTEVLMGCCISNCTNRYRNTANMYSIPIWGNYNSWLKYMVDIKVDRGKLHDLRQYRACERHFSAESLQRVFNMVPTLNLPSKAYYEVKLQSYLQNRGLRIEKMNSIIDSNEPIAQKRTSLSKKGATDGPNEFCAYLGCVANKKEVYYKFYKFPTDFERAIKWINHCKLPDLLRKSRTEIEKFIANSSGVCFKHKIQIESMIRRNEMYSVKAKSKVETAKFTIKVYQGKTEVEKTVSHNEDVSTANGTEKNSNSGCSGQSTGEETYVPVREYCAFVNCLTYIKNPGKKYRFPADNELLAEWIEAAGIPRTLSENTIRTLFVCGKHFNANQYTKMGTLILSSVPAPHTEFVDTSSHESNEHLATKQRKTQNIYVPEVPESDEAVSSTASTVSDKRILSNLQGAATVVSDKQIRPTQPATDLVNQIRIDKVWGGTASGSDCVVKHCPSNEKTNVLYLFPLHNKYRLVRWVKAVENKTNMATQVYLSYINKKICDRHFEKECLIGKTDLRQDAVPTLHLVEEIPGEDTREDTSVVWQECSGDPFESFYSWDTDKSNIPESLVPHIKGNAILHSNSIEFPNMKRELKFGKDCPKLGHLKRFPFNVHKMKNVVNAREVKAGHKVQVHTAIIVDDDDESEREAINLISKIIKQNSKLAPGFRPRPRGKTAHRRKY